MNEIISIIQQDADHYRKRVDESRAKLAELEAEYTKINARVNAIQVKLFNQLKEYYKKRDNLRLIIDYRKRLLASYKMKNFGSAKKTKIHYEQAYRQNEKDYEETINSMEEKKKLDGDQEAELVQLWKKLVKLYHPDHFSDKPDIIETYHKLTVAINQAKENGNISTLREIADDPHGFILRNGWKKLVFTDTNEIEKLQQLYETLQEQIRVVDESLNTLLMSNEYNLSRQIENNPCLFDKLISEREVILTKEIKSLEKEADQLSNVIIEYGGTVDF